MNIAFEIGLCLILLAAGFMATYDYLHEIKWTRFEKDALRITRNKVIYLLCGIAVAALLITMFQVVYRQDYLTQVKLLILAFMIQPCAATDLRVQKIPNAFIIAALVLRVIIYIAELIDSPASMLNVLKDNLLGAVVIGGFFLILALVFKNSIGMGDIKLFFVMGLYQGLWGAVSSVFFSLVVSFFAAIFLLVTRKKGRKDVISFGPSILLGTVISMALTGM